MCVACRLGKLSWEELRLERPQNRPRVELDLDLPPEECLRRIGRSLKVCPDCCDGSVVGRHVNLVVHPRERHFWSPWLQMSVRPSKEGAGARLRGQFGPHPSIWTGFVFSYSVFTLTAVLGSMVGISQQIVEEPAWGWLLVPLGGLGISVTYLAAMIGRHLGAEQMGRMRRFLADALEDASEGGSEVRDDAGGDFLLRKRASEGAQPSG